MKPELQWTEQGAEHIGRHGVDIEETLDVFYGRSLRQAGHSGRLRIIGTTEFGRILTIVVERRTRWSYSLVTARDADETEKRSYRKWRGVKG